MADASLVISVIALLVAVVALAVALSVRSGISAGPQPNVLSAPTPWPESAQAPASGEAPASGGAPGEAEIFALLSRGQKIPAIKLYRQRTGAGLKEAKDAVEAMERRGPTA
jgi:ribosomal protein L7/L12